VTVYVHKDCTCKQIHRGDSMYSAQDLRCIHTVYILHIYIFLYTTYRISTVYKYTAETLSIGKHTCDFVMHCRYCMNTPQGQCVHGCLGTCSFYNELQILYEYTTGTMCIYMFKSMFFLLCTADTVWIHCRDRVYMDVWVCVLF